MISLRSAGLALLLTAATTGFTLSQVGETVAFVVDCSGEWTIGAKGPILKAGDGVPAGALLRPSRPSDAGYLSLCLFTGEVRTYKTAARLEVPTKPALADRVWTALRTRFDSRFVHTLSRADELDDVVVGLDGRSIDVTEMLAAVAVPRQAQLRFQRLNASGQPVGVPVGPLVVETTSSGPLIVADSGLRVGLWRVTLLRSVNDKPESTGATAWALLVAPVQQRRIHDEFVTLRNTLRDRSPDADVGLLRGLSRTCLLDLAERAATEK